VLLAATPRAASDALDRQAAINRTVLNDARTRAAEAERQSEVVATRARAIGSRAERERLSLAALALRIQASEARLEVSRARLALLDRLRTRQQADLTQRRRPLMELVAALQLLLRRPPLALFAEPGSTTDLIHARALMDVILPTVRARTADLQRRVAASQRLARLQRLAVTTLAENGGELAARRRTLARRERELRLQATTLDARAGLEADRAVALAGRASDVTQLLRTFEASGAVRDRLARLAGPVPRPGTVTGRGEPAVARIAPAAATPAYRPPVVGDVVAGLGAELPTGQRTRGLTLTAAAGAQVVAPADGRVVFAGPFRSFGMVTIIDHGGGWTSLVTGMVALNARVGDAVVQGSPIGRAGGTAPRITVELRRQGVPVDIGPLLY
jgi:murein hydrolase activator